MRKYTLLIAILFFIVTGFGQSSSSTENQLKVDLPTIIPPSPSVAALMKFEEIPVSNYTGIPDISIPLFSTTGKHGLPFNMTLNYSPSSVKMEEVAGYTGLGWSLFAGGTISRTVRDIPDEAYVLPNNFTSKKIGIYHNNSSTDYDNNNYYTVLPNLADNYNYIINHPDDEEMNRFLFEVNEKQKFDSKHDLYQFNFMGYTGRFIIEKKPDGSYQVSKLEKDNLIINYDSQNKVFEIKDTNGFRYIFDVKELSTSHYFNVVTDIMGQQTETPGENYDDIISAFHLSKIFFNDELIVEISYEGGFSVERQVNRNWTRNIPIGPPIQFLRDLAYYQTSPSIITDGILPLDTHSYNEIEVKTKKISQIDIKGKAIIDFELGVGSREDINVSHPELSKYLHKIKVSDVQGNLIHSYEMAYRFGHKLFLETIKEGVSPNQLTKYQFKYKDLDLNYSDFDSDYWGYYKLKDIRCSDLETMNREPSKQYCTKDVLKQIIYPTKGSSIFEFESNTYSYQGNIPIEDNELALQGINFDNNPDNWLINNAYQIVIDNDLGGNYIGNQSVSSLGSKSVFLGSFSSNRTLIFYVDTNALNNENIVALKVQKRNNSGSVVSEYSIYSSTCKPVELNLEAGFDYYILFSWDNNAELLYNNITIDEKNRNPIEYNFLYGGGIRIKNIYYTNDNSPEMETQDTPNNYVRKIMYDYNFFNTSRSSGSLVYDRPVLKYESKRKFNQMTGSHNIFTFVDVTYSVFSKSNNLSFISTKGSDVGYKNVTVSESSNGRTEYEYLSPIDYPEDINARNVIYPFAPTSNIDYKRGHLLKERKYTQSNRIILDSHNTYSFVDDIKTTGITTFYLEGEDCPYAGMFNKYDDYRSGVLDPNTYLDCENQVLGCCQVVGSGLNYNARICGNNVSSFVSCIIQKEAYGWAKLIDKTTQNYFYDDANNQRVVETQEHFTYNDSNKQIASQTSTTSTGEIVETKYFYPQDQEMNSEPYAEDLIEKNMVATPLVTETKKNDMLISKQHTIYKDWGNNLLLPEIISTQKGDNPEEDRINYVSYDTHGNPTCLRLTNGMYISYIWGYNNSQPIAKIENASYSSINPNLITAIQNATDSPTITEENLIIALNALRTALPNAMVTTFTYKPLVGVSTITDPKGMRTYYEYDSFGRLKTVKDAAGNKLSENEYHYRP